MAPSLQLAAQHVVTAMFVHAPRYRAQLLDETIEATAKMRVRLNDLPAKLVLLIPTPFFGYISNISTFVCMMSSTAKLRERLKDLPTKLVILIPTQRICILPMHAMCV